jgi:hypothetical protein
MWYILRNFEKFLIESEKQFNLNGSNVNSLDYFTLINITFKNLKIQKNLIVKLIFLKYCLKIKIIAIFTFFKNLVKNWIMN